MSNMLQCDIVVSKFELQLFYQSNAPWEQYESCYFPCYGLNRTNTVLLQEGFDIKLPMKVDMSLKTKIN